MAPLARFLCLAAAVGGLLAASACQTSRIKVEMVASGDTTTRTFASNSLDRRDIDRLRDVYASEPTRDAETGGTLFSGSFGETLPSELGNRNGLVAMHTRLGSAHFYYEAFGDASPLWSDLRRRMDAGELWVRLFGRWAERHIDDASKREEWRVYVDQELVPLVCDAVLLWASQASTARYSRVEQNLRATDDVSEKTEDERFAERLGMPLLLLLAERGLFTPDETQRLLALGADGNLSPSEREWAVKQLFLPAVTRQVRRFRPDIESVRQSDLVPLAIGFYLYATTSIDRNEVLLASPAISEEDKARLRRGEAILVLPPPFGFDPLKRPKSTEAEVHLATGAKPYLHNGVWDDERHEIRFKASFVQPERRTTLFPAVFYAAWSEPDAAAQTKLFGAVILEGEALAGYASWQASLPAATAARWDQALDRLAAGKGAEALDAIRLETRAERPMPQPLADWIQATVAPDAANRSGDEPADRAKL